MNNQKELFETMPVPKAVMKMAIPTIVGSLIMIIYNMTDVYFIGYIDDPCQTAAIALAGNITLLYIAIENIFGIGGGSVVGRSLGSGDYQRAKGCSAFCIWGSIAAAILFAFIYTIGSDFCLSLVGADAENIIFAKQYMFYACTLGVLPSILVVVLSFLIRTEGYAVPATIGSMSGCIINMILDPFFILPGFLNMGAAGAGLATMIGNVFGCVYLLLFILKKRKTSVISLNFISNKITAPIVKGTFEVGIPAAIQNMLNVTGMAVLNQSVAKYGSEAVAAMGVAYKLYSMPMYFAMALTQGAIPIISYNAGSKNAQRIRETKNFTLILALGTTILLGIMEFFNSEALIRCFIDVKETVYLGGIYLKELSLAIPLHSMDFFGVGILQAIGAGKSTLYMALIRKICLEIPLIVLMSLFGATAFGFAPVFTELLLAAISMWMVRREERKIQYRPD